MPIDSALGRLGLTQGVCTSSTRPANPYEGQLIYETDTNRTLVYDNSAWLVVADNAILRLDTTNNRIGINTQTPATALDVVGSTTVRAAATQDGVALVGRAGGSSSYEVSMTPTTLTADRTLTLPDKNGTVATTADSGLIFLRREVFSGAANVPFNGVFDTSTYNQYRIIISGDGSANGQQLQMQMRTGTTNQGGASDYIWTYWGFYTVTGTWSGSAGAASYGYLGFNRVFNVVIDLFLDAAGTQTYTRYNFHSTAYSGNWGGQNGSVFLNTTNQSYDGFILFPSTGTITGTCRVYGYRNI